MSEAVVANRYADALFQFGTEKNILDQLVDQFRTVKEVLITNQSFRLVLEHPQISREKKQQLVETVFQGMDSHVIHTMKLLVERKRVAIIGHMVERLEQLVNDAKGVAVAHVYSVRQLTDAELQSMAQAIAKRFQKQEVKINNIVDPTIIGGLKVRVGNTIIDGSVSGKLERLERQFATQNN
ncbi:MAG TPA: F0F1 ATP synthase subunit delta [Cerasibacillus sp.]|uniref:F0F1 ATP synthase subunit delta n=1 Tax=Cerasibacillus sp. TaxID=2498711 RepID=UPI002F3ED9C7